MDQYKSPSYEQDELDNNPNIIGDLYNYTFQGQWDEVVKLYEKNPEMWSAEINSSGDTALHMVINDDKEGIVEKLVDIILKADPGHDQKKVEALKKANEMGETPLHRAAARGSVIMCKCILEAATIMEVDNSLMSIPNKWGENPIFITVLDNRKHAFLYFLLASDKDEKLLTCTGNGDTVLHAAIRREHHDLAFHIMRLCPSLMGRCNEKGITPLHILASKPSAFRSGTHFSWWQLIIYYSIRVDLLEYDISIPERTIPSSEFDDQYPHNYKTCYEFLRSFVCVVAGEGLGKAKRDPENHCVKANVPENCATWFHFLFMLLQSTFGLLGFGKKIEEIVRARQKHRRSVQILDELMKDPGKTYMTKDGSNPGTLDPDFGNPLHDFTDQLPEKFKQQTKLDDKGEGSKDKSQQRTDTALLVAAQKGAVEVMNKILERLPVSIHDTSSNKKNIVLVAVENRQPRILKALDEHLNIVLKKPKLWGDLLRGVDADDNTILHLAAKYDESMSKPWQIHGSAMQMQWEIKWYQLVKSYSPSHFIFLTNKQEETPSQIFTRGHSNLVQKSSEWLKDTSESCSVVAALVAGVSFATSSQVPGGTDDETGKPKLEARPAFELFAVTALIGLCFSVTALIMFLSILTSRKEAKDFKRSLPLKLLIGLSSLFVSIASMLISFCAAHFFVLEDKFKKAVFPLYAATCLPVSIYAIAQFPLFMDLLKAIVRKVPDSHDLGHL